MSFILIGIGRRTHKDLGETGQRQHCFRCSNSVVYHLVHIKTWFTCFFIPFFPYKSEFTVECPICRHGIELRGAEIKEAKQGTLKISVLRD